MALRVIQISDCHLFADPETLTKNSVNNEEHLDAVLEYLLEKEKHADLILLTGDIADEGASSAYQRLATKLIRLPQPIYYVPGNHDNAKALHDDLQGFNIKKNRHFIKNSWQFILLNTAIPNYVEGYLPENELKLLQSYLKKNKHLFTCIVMHHHPILTDSFMDEVPLMNRDVFLNMLNESPQVRAVLFGHVHQAFTTRIEQCHFLAAPAISYQFQPHAKEFAIESTNPCYRWIEFEYNGNIKTGSIYINKVD